MEQFLALSDRVVRHKESVDRSLAKLGLDKPVDSWQLDYSRNLADLSARHAPNEAEDDDCPAEETPAPGAIVDDATGNRGKAADDARDDGQEEEDDDEGEEEAEPP